MLPYTKSFAVNLINLYCKVPIKCKVLIKCNKPLPLISIGRIKPIKYCDQISELLQPQPFNPDLLCYTLSQSLHFSVTQHVLFSCTFGKLLRIE